MELALKVDELATRWATLGLHYNLGSCHEAKHHGNQHSGKEAKDKWAGTTPQQKGTNEKCGN